MRLAGLLAYRLARFFDVFGNWAYRVSKLLYSLVPVFLGPKEISGFIRDYYRTVYPEDAVEEWLPDSAPDLTPWEVKLFDRHNVRSGRMLVLGSGSGRESVALAHRGVRVIGVDTNAAAVRIAHRLARQEGAAVSFHMGIFLDLPYGPASFDFVFLSSNMLSSIPGSTQRQSFLAGLDRVLKTGGLAVVGFLREQREPSRIKRMSWRLYRLLARLPWANHLYQPGDECLAGHFFHAFQHEAEIRAELARAGARIRELNWTRGLVVLDFPSTQRKRMSLRQEECGASAPAGHPAPAIGSGVHPGPVGSPRPTGPDLDSDRSPRHPGGSPR